MAHVYLEPEHRQRPWWPSLSGRWQPLHDSLLARPSVDLSAVAIDAERIRVSHHTRGSAVITRDRASARWSYERDNGGDPLGVGHDVHAVTSADAHAACIDTDYPDGIVQLADVVPSQRAGDIVISAAPGWDLRDRYEPTPHRSTHGALHRAQMMVPLVIDAPPRSVPLRTADVMPSALVRMQLDVPDGLDGISWLG
jgi:hypothetical protein